MSNQYGEGVEVDTLAKYETDDDTRGVSRSLSDITEAISRQESLVDQLAKRLATVTRPGINKVAVTNENEKALASEKSDLAHDLSSEANRVHNLADRINSLIRNLDL